MNSYRLVSVCIVAIALGVALADSSVNTDLKCAGATDSSSYNRGDEVIVCIHIVELKKKIPFKLTVDNYSGLDLKGVYTAMKGYATYDTIVKSTGFSLVVQSYQDSIQTDALIYSQQANSATVTPAYVFPLYSAIINIQDGKIESIEWDNGCWNGSAPEVCKSVQVSVISSDKKVLSTYQQSNNYVTNCSTNATDGSCDPKVYISWMGTDSSGNYMTSAGLRMSRFQSYSVGEFYQSSKSAFNGINF